MCNSVRSAIDVLKTQTNRKTLTRGETIMLFEKVIEDSQKMGERMTALETRVESVENKVIAIGTKIDDMDKKLDSLINKPSVFANKLADNKWFWISIIIFMLLMGSLFGANLEWIKGAFSIVGG